MLIQLVSTLQVDECEGGLIPIAMDAKKVPPPLGIYLLAGVLRGQGHTVEVVDLIAQGDLDLSSHLAPPVVVKVPT